MGETTQAGAELPLTLSDSAVRRIGVLMAAEDNPALKLRISVSGGGCSGFRYGFSFDDAVNPDDLIFGRDGVTVVVDEISFGLLAGSEIDYVEELIGASFQIRNPNSTSSCGCGASFAV